MADSKFDKDGSVLGDLIRQLRLQKKFSQADLAGRCGVQRTTINMIEQGKRNPSMGLLRGLIENLTGTSDEKRRMLYALIGEDPKEPSNYRELDQYAPPNNVDLWILSDTLAENVLDNKWLDATIDDIKNGKKRYYFLPESKCQYEKNLFLRALKKREIEKDTYRSRVRFFALQEPLSSLICLLRLGVQNPRVDSAAEVSIEADKRSRVPFSEGLVPQILLDLNKVLRAIERGNPGGGYHGIREVKLDDEVEQDST